MRLEFKVLADLCDVMMKTIDFLLEQNLGHDIDMQLLELYKSFEENKKIFEVLLKTKEA